MRLLFLDLSFIFIFFTSFLYAYDSNSSEYNATKMADDLNIAYQDYNFLMALSGILVGFLILYFSIKLVSKY